MTEGETQRAARFGLVTPHRQQHMGGLRYAGRARRPRRALDPLCIEQHEQRVTLAPWERQMAVPGQTLVAGRTVQGGVRHDFADSAYELVTKLSHELGAFGLTGDRQLGGASEAHDRWGVDRPR